MFKCAIKFAKLVIVSSTLVVLGTTAVMPTVHASADIVTQGMSNFCNAHGYTGAIQSGSTPDHKYSGYYCTKSDNNQSYLLIPNNLLPPHSGLPGQP